MCLIGQYLLIPCVMDNEISDNILKLFTSLIV